MKNNSKRGFTIVELIIVIAVIAILAAMLIPTFSELIRQTQEAKDTSLVRELNVALRMDTDNAGHETMDQAVKAAAANGIDLSKHKATVPGNVILWDSENDLFAYYKVDKDGNNGEISYIPEYQPAKQLKDAYKFWTVVTDIDGNSAYSQYLAGTDKTGDVVVTAGFDAGDNTGIATVTYNGGSTAKNVIIRTNSSATTLNINAYVGATAQDSDTVKHYGYLGKLVVNTMATASYHEYGTVAFATINQGRVVAEDKGVIEVAYVTDASAFVQENGGVVTQAYAATQDIASASAEEGKKALTYKDADEVEEIGNEKMNEAIIKNANFHGVAVSKKGQKTELITIEQFRDNCNKSEFDGYKGYTVKLLDDITIDGNWTPINEFKGVFDGNNKTIDGAKIVGTNNCGFFGKLTGQVNSSLNTVGDAYDHSSNSLTMSNFDEYKYTCVVKNLTFKNSTVTSMGENVGILAGYITNAFVSRVTTDDSCTVSAKDGKVGGIVGYQGNSVVANCENNAAVSAQKYNVGGVVGTARKADTDRVNVIFNCVNNGKVSATVNNGGIGGVLGQYSQSEVVVFGCENNATVEITNTATSGSNYGQGVAAGIIGSAGGGKATVVANCSNSGKIMTSVESTTADQLSGIVSNYGGGLIINCTNNAEVSGKARAMGGICAVPCCATTINHCTSDVMPTNSDADNAGAVSKLVAFLNNDGVTYANMTFANYNELQECLPYSGKTLYLDSTIKVTDKSGKLTVRTNIVSSSADVLIENVQTEGSGNLTVIDRSGDTIKIEGIIGALTLNEVGKTYEILGQVENLYVEHGVNKVIVKGNVTVLNANDTVTIINEGTIETAYIGGANSRVTNKGELNIVNVKGVGTTIINESQGEMKQLNFYANATFTNEGKVETTGSATTMRIFTDGVTVTVNNNGTISNADYYMYWIEVNNAHFNVVDGASSKTICRDVEVVDDSNQYRDHVVTEATYGEEKVVYSGSSINHTKA